LLTPPLYAHQRVAVEELVRDVNPATGRVLPRCFFLGDEMRLGKSRCVVDAAVRMFEEGRINHVIVVAPAPARSVWYAPPDSPVPGQIAQFCTAPISVREYRAKSREWQRPEEGEPRRLRWTITNYEFARRPERIAELLNVADERTILVLDEAMAVKSPTAKQTKALYKLRLKCGRIWLLDGTPEGDTPGDQFAPFKVMDWRIVGCENWIQFRGRYAVMGGYAMMQRVQVGPGKWEKRMMPVQIVRWVNLDDLSKRTAPYILRRRMKDVFDLPPVLDPVVLTATLTADSWKAYKEMKQDCLVWLSENELAPASLAATRIMRLAQITSGFLGGIETVDGDHVEGVRAIGHEKLDVVLDWHAQQLAADPNFKTILWCRFRAEVERLVAELATRVPIVGTLYGGMKQDDRDAVKALLYPRSAPPGPVVVVGTARTGGFALNLAAANTIMYVSNDWSRVVREQSSARILGPDQKSPAAYFDVVAEGPNGQRTVDHVVLKALLDKKNVANLTSAEWRATLESQDG
jgi:hypothetical protein